MIDDLLRAHRAQHQQQELLPHRPFPASMPCNVFVPPGAVQMPPYQHPQHQLALQNYPVAQTPPMQYHPKQHQQLLLSQQYEFEQPQPQYPPWNEMATRALNGVQDIGAAAGSALLAGAAASSAFFQRAFRSPQSRHSQEQGLNPFIGHGRPQPPALPAPVAPLQQASSPFHTPAEAARPAWLPSAMEGQSGFAEFLAWRAMQRLGLQLSRPALQDPTAPLSALTASVALQDCQCLTVMAVRIRAQAVSTARQPGQRTKGLQRPSP